MGPLCGVLATGGSPTERKSQLMDAKYSNLSSGVGMGSVALTSQRRAWLITYHGPLWMAIVAPILCQGCGQGASPLTLAYVEISWQMLAGGCAAVKAEFSGVSLVC